MFVGQRSVHAPPPLPPPPLKMRQRNVLHPMDEGLAMVLPTHVPLSQRVPSVPVHDELLRADDYVQWAVFAVFACPAVLARPDIFQLFQQIGRSLLVIPLAEQLTFNLHAEAETLAKWLSSPGASKTLVVGFRPTSLTPPPLRLTPHLEQPQVSFPKTLKIKKEMADLAKQAAVTAGKQHKERRSYLQGGLSTLIQLIRDVPGLLAPKFPEVMAALAMTRGEVQTYMIHAALVSGASKTKSKLYKSEHYLDARVSELVGASVELSELVLQHRSIVQEYVGVEAGFAPGLLPRPPPPSHP